MPVSRDSVDLACRLLALEGGQERPTGGGVTAGRVAERGGGSAIPLVRVCAKLRTMLGALVGTTGFRTLLARALTLATAHDAALADVRVLDDGSLSGIDEGSAAAGTAAAEALVAQILDLVITFIGLALLLQLLRADWPEVSSGAPGTGSSTT
ncbi:hypothetical protein K2Z84_09160 [Candidatus Binatia bacterium]|nr:hypothetical protein [Candidatus Binatia bacterium]